MVMRLRWHKGFILGLTVRKKLFSVGSNVKVD